MRTSTVAVFRYVALDVAGKKHRGLVEGDGPADARESLRRKKLFVSKISPCQGEGAPPSKWAALRGLFDRDRSAEMAMPLRELATLLSAGVPLVQALGALANQSENSRAEGLFLGIRERVMRGESLSAATAAYPRYFGPVAQNMIAAGEGGGGLDGALRRLSEGLLRRREIMGKVSAALVYPAILTTVSLAVVVFLLTYVVPRISRVYLETGASLPLPTQVLLATSAFFESHWVAIFLTFLSGCFLVRVGLRNERLATAWDRVKLQLPFMGTVYRKRCVAMFSGTLCGLLQAGVPLVEALRVTAGTLGNRVVAGEVRRVADEVDIGGEASQALRRNGVFPETLAEMMAAGEESGEMVELLETLSTDYEHQVAMTAERACRALEPLVVVFMGSVVLFIVLSVLLPIVRISQQVRF